MKPRIYLSGIWLLVIVGITVFSINLVPAENKPEQDRRFEILSGKVDVIAIRTNLPENEDSESSFYEFDIIVNAKDTSFTIPTAIIAVNGLDEAVSRIKDGTEWKDEYLFLPSECGGGNMWRCNTAEVFTVRGDKLIRIGSVAREYENGLFYDVYAGLEDNELTSHASAPEFTVVMREVDGRFVVDLDLTWENNPRTSLTEVDENQPTEGETPVSAILFNAALAKYCDRKEELARYTEEARTHLDADQFSRFNRMMSRVKPGQPPGE